VSGLTLLQEYRADPAIRDIPVIVLSTKEDAAVKSESFSLGASDYLVKLPDPIELIARIRLHSRARAHQQQRDEAYRALRESQQQLVVSNRELAERIAELQLARDELSRAVSTDALTGLASRRRWFEAATNEFNRYRRHRRPLGLLIADLDSFKLVNDTFGHGGGDEVLRQFGSLIGGVCRQTDVAGRIGGEEFVLLLPETSTPGAEELARRLIEKCRDLAVHAESAVIRVSCSAGVTEAGRGDETIEDVLRRADVALYAAKRSGGDGWACHPPLAVAVRPQPADA
jgi:two-component system chemotaxis family response regulator WspR